MPYKTSDTEVNEGYMFFHRLDIKSQHVLWVNSSLGRGRMEIRSLGFFNQEMDLI